MSETVQNSKGANFQQPALGLSDAPLPVLPEGLRDFTKISRELLALDDDKIKEIAKIMDCPPEVMKWFGATAINTTVELKKAKAKNEELSRRLETDPKTGALSSEAAQKAFAEVGIKSVVDKQPMQILFADLNRLKLVNDLMGHDVGDEYLRSTVRAFKNFFGDDSKIIRWNEKHGDEFIIVTLLPTKEKSVQAINGDHINATIGASSYVKTFLEQDGFLTRRQIAALREECPSALSASIGGVFLQPDDVQSIGQEIIANERTLDSVINALSKATDTIMYKRKKGDEVATDQQFTQDDLYSKTTKFKNGDLP